MLKDAITSGNMGVFNQLNDLVQKRTVIKKREEDDHAPVEHFDILDLSSELLVPKHGRLYIR